MRLEKCSFCSSTVWPGHGIHFVRNDSQVFKFCRPKCHKAFKKRKNPRRTRWTKAFRKTMGKELTIDPALEFDKKRDIPVKYSRELWQRTSEAVKKVIEIRSTRERLHIKNRLKRGKQLRDKQMRRNVEKNIALIRSPAAGMRQPEVVVEEEDEEEQEAMEAEQKPGPSRVAADEGFEED